MAIRVPTLSGSGTQQQRLPGVRQQGGRSVADFMDITETSVLDSVSKAADSMQRASMSLYAREVADANKLRVQDSVDQLTAYDQDAAFSETGWRNQKGEAVFRQQNNKPLTENILESRQKRIDEIIENLDNDQQRQAFLEYSDQSGLQLRGNLMGHEAEQHRVYKRGVLALGIDTATRNMVLYYNDENRLKNAIDSIEQASKDLGHMEYGSEEVGILNSRKHVSNALNQAIEASINQGDHASATRILQQFSQRMDINDMLTAYKLIVDEQEARVSLNVGQEVIGEMYPLMQPNDFERMINITLQTESGNRRYEDDGTLVTSPKGAMGEMQVMPGTAKGPGYGVKPVQNDTPDELARLGKDYLAAMLRKYKGDKAKAWAAYNAGPKRVDTALEMAKSTGLPWMGFLPDETEAYVIKNMKAFSAGQGRPTQPTLAKAKQLALAKLGDDASSTLQKRTLDIVESNYTDQIAAIKQREEEATGEVMRHLMENGGHWEDLSATLRGSVPVANVEKVMKFANTIRAGQPIKTDWDLWYKFRTDPKLLRETRLTAFRDLLADTEFKQLTDEQEKLLNPIEQRTSVRTPKDILDVFLRQAGINPNPEPGEEDAEKVGRIWGAFENLVGERERDLERKLDSEEMRKIAALLFTEVNIRYGDNKPLVLVDIDDEVVVPVEERKLIIEAWKAERPDRPITEDDIFYMYGRKKGLF